MGRTDLINLIDGTPMCFVLRMVTMVIGNYSNW